MVFIRKRFFICENLVQIASLVTLLCLSSGTKIILSGVSHFTVSVLCGMYIQLSKLF